MVASANGVVAWRRHDVADDPVLTMLGGDETRPERVADRRLMRLLRCFGVVGVGARTLREQPGLVQTPQEPGEPPVPALYEFRARAGLPYHPRVVVYSLHGTLPLDHPAFHTPGLGVIAVTGEAGGAELERRGAAAVGLSTIVEALPDPAALRRSHEIAARGDRHAVAVEARHQAQRHVDARRHRGGGQDVAVVHPPVRHAGDALAGGHRARAVGDGEDLVEAVRHPIGLRHATAREGPHGPVDVEDRESLEQHHRDPTHWLLRCHPALLLRDIPRFFEPPS